MDAEDLQQSTSNEKTMGIWEHFNELRQRLFLALMALVIATAISALFADRIIQWLAIPLGGADRLISIEVTENIGVFMRVSLLSGFIFSLPVILYEILAFIMPGLTPSERKWVLIAIPVASILFASGVAFSYFVMLPVAIPFLVTFLTGVQTTPRLSNYIFFVTNMMFWIGIAFETPIVTFVLAKLRIVSPKTLLRYWRVAVVVIALVSAVLTPTPDPVNMAILMVPLFLIYLISVLFAVLAG